MVERDAETGLLCMMKNVMTEVIRAETDALDTAKLRKDINVQKKDGNASRTLAEMEFSSMTNLAMTETI